MLGAKTRFDEIVHDDVLWVRHTIWGKVDQQFTSRRVGTKMYVIDSTFKDTILTLKENFIPTYNVVIGNYHAIFIPKEG